MSTFPNSHLYFQNGIYKIVLSFEDQEELQNEESVDKHIKENKIVELDFEGMSQEGSSVTIKKDGQFIVDNEEQKLHIQNSQKKYELKKNKRKKGGNDENNENDFIKVEENDEENNKGKKRKRKHHKNKKNQKDGNKN